MNPKQNVPRTKEHKETSNSVIVDVCLVTVVVVEATKSTTATRKTNIKHKQNLPNTKGHKQPNKHVIVDAYLVAVVFVAYHCFVVVFLFSGLAFGPSSPVPNGHT